MDNPEDLIIGDIIEFQDPKTAIEQLLFDKGQGSYPNKVLITKTVPGVFELVEDGLISKYNAVCAVGFDQDMQYVEFTVGRLQEEDVVYKRSLRLEEVAHDIFSETNPAYIGLYWNADEDYRKQFKE